MLPIFIMEQESKAQMHFRQLAFLSGMLNRTVVLPNVAGSRLGACLEHDFDFYYSSQWAVDHADYFSTISMETSPVGSRNDWQSAFLLRHKRSMCI